MNTVSPSRAIELIAIADAIEISESHRQVALYMWSDDRRSWMDTGSFAEDCERSTATIYALVNLAQRVGLTVAAWKDRKRIA